MNNLSPSLKIDGDKLYPHLSPEERAEAANNLARYIDVIRRIYERNRDFDKARPER